MRRLTTATSEPRALRRRRLVVITVNYYCSELVAGLVEATMAIGDPDLSFIVVDNSVQDPGLDVLSRWPSLTLLRAPANLGFGAGCNLGLAHARDQDPGAIAWLLNPDARLLPGAIATVRRALEESPRPAVLGTRIRDLEGRHWFDRGRFDPWLGRLLHRPDPAAAPQGFPEPAAAPSRQRADLRPPGCDLSESSDWLSGCSLILDLEALGAPPRFDPQIFLDYEDAELCLRLAKQGHLVRVTRAVLVEHAVSAVTARVPQAKYRHATFSKLYVLYLHATPLALGLNLLYYALRPLLQLRRDPAQAQGRWAGLIDFLAWWARRLRGDQRLRHPRTRFTASS